MYRTALSQRLSASTLPSASKMAFRSFSAFSSAYCLIFSISICFCVPVSFFSEISISSVEGIGRLTTVSSCSVFVIFCSCSCLSICEQPTLTVHKTKTTIINSVLLKFFNLIISNIPLP